MAYRRKYKRNYRRRSRPTKYGRRMGRQSFRTRVKKVLNKMSETKYYQYARENVQLYHDVGAGSGPATTQTALIFNPWQIIGQGANNHQRIGDKITPRVMTVRLWLANKSDRPNMYYRIVVARLPKNYNGTITASNTIDLFRADDGGFNGNTLCGMIDNEKGVRAYYDRVFSNQHNFSTANPGGVPKECFKFIKFNIKRKGARPIVYEPTGGIVNNPIAIYVIPYDSYGTLQTDNIASCAITIRLYYKDI